MGSVINSSVGTSTPSSVLGIGAWKDNRISELVKDAEDPKCSEWGYKPLKRALQHLFFPEEIQPLCTRFSKERKDDKKKVTTRPVFHLLFGTAAQLDKATGEPYSKGGVLFEKRNQ